MKFILAIFVTIISATATYFLLGMAEKLMVPPELKNLPAAAVSLINYRDNPNKLRHELAKETYFTQSVVFLAPKVAAPEIVDTRSQADLDVEVLIPEDEVRDDWTGVVLIPDRNQMSKAYSSVVEITRIEAHPLTDDSLRIWARVENKTSQELRVQVRCDFKFSSGTGEPQPFTTLLLPARGYRDVRFLSGQSDVQSYTILVRE